MVCNNEIKYESLAMRDNQTDGIYIYMYHAEFTINGILPARNHCNWDTPWILINHQQLR
jgi:hypothetical protein